MKNAVQLFCSLFFISSFSQAQWNEVKQNQIVTFGSATLYFSAERAQFNFSVKGTGSTINDAVRQASDRLTRIAGKLGQVGILDTDLQTSFFNSSDNPEGKSWFSSTKDFAAAFQVTVTIDSFALIEPAIAAITSEPVENLSSLRFSLRDNSEKRFAAQKTAAEDAKKKAELIAETLGASIARVLYIEDQGGSDGREVEVAAMGMPRYVFYGNKIPITSRIRVIFELGYNK